MLKATIFREEGYDLSEVARLNFPAMVERVIRLPLFLRSDDYLAFGDVVSLTRQCKRNLVVNDIESMELEATASLSTPVLRDKKRSM